MDDVLPGNASDNENDGSLVSSTIHDEKIIPWYFSREEIEKYSPSRRDGIDLNKETRLRKSYCSLLEFLGQRLKLPQITVATAMVFCHRFFIRQSHTKNDRWTIATVCMFVAGKVEETPLALDDVIIASYEIIHKKDLSAAQRKEVYEQQKELVLRGEELVLSTLNYDIIIRHPYRPLVETVKKYMSEDAKAQVQLAWKFVNDSFWTTLCLQYKPNQIAAGALFLATELRNMDLLKLYGSVLCQEVDITPYQLEDIRSQILELYERKHIATSQESKGESSGGVAVVHQPVSRDMTSTDKCPSSDIEGGSSKGDLSQSDDRWVKA